MKMEGKPWGFRITNKHNINKSEMSDLINAFGSFKSLFDTHEWDFCLQFGTVFGLPAALSHMIKQPDLNVVMYVTDAATAAT